MHTEKPAPYLPDELEWPDCQGKHAAKHMHTEHEFPLQIHLTLFGEVRVRLKAR